MLLQHTMTNITSRLLDNKCHPKANVKSLYCADHLLLLQFPSPLFRMIGCMWYERVIYWILCSCIKSSCNSIYNPLMFLIGDCCVGASVASDPDLIQSKCLGMAACMGKSTADSDCNLTITDHSAVQCPAYVHVCSVYPPNSRWAVHVLLELRAGRTNSSYHPSA